MTFTITGKQMNVGGALTTHAEESVKNLIQKYQKNPVETSIVINKQSHLYITDLSIHLKQGVVFRAHGEADEPYASFDKAINKLGTLLHKNKDRENECIRISRKIKENLNSKDYNSNSSPAISDEAKDSSELVQSPLIIAELSSDLPTLTPAQAVDYMQDLKTNVLIFRNIRHNGINMVYLRKDGNISWVDPDNM